MNVGHQKDTRARAKAASKTKELKSLFAKQKAADRKRKRRAASRAAAQSSTGDPTTESIPESAMPTGAIAFAVGRMAALIDGVTVLAESEVLAAATGDRAKVEDSSDFRPANKITDGTVVTSYSDGTLQSTAASRDAKNPLLACGARGSLAIFDMADPVNPQTVALLSRLPGNVWSCAWSPDNTMLAFSASNRLMLWKDDHQTQQMFQAETEIHSIAWSTADMLLAVGTSEGGVHLLDTKGWSSRKLETPFQYQVGNLGFSTDGNLFFGQCSGDSIGKPEVICVWRTDTWEQVIVLDSKLAEKDERTRSIGFLPDTDVFVSHCDADRRVRTINLTGVITPQQRTAIQQRRRRTGLVEASNPSHAIWSLKTELNQAQKLMISEVEETLRLLEGKEFENAEEMKSFASVLGTVLMPLGMRIRCPSGKYAGYPARLSVTKAGSARAPRFCYLVSDGKKLKAITEYANGMRVPVLTLCDAPEDGRRTRFNAIKPDLEESPPSK